MSDFEDFLVEEFVFRHQNPKKRLAHKRRHGFCYFNKDNGLLSKNLVVEQKLEDFQNRVGESKETNIRNSEDGVILDNFGVKYSQGKKKGWELKKSLLNDEVPNPDRDLTSVSVAHFTTMRMCDFRGSWMHYGLLSPDFRYGVVNTRLKSIRNVSDEGERKIGNKRGNVGKMHRNTDAIPCNSEKEHRIHVEYQVLDFVVSNRLWNVYKFRPFADDRYPEVRAPVEGHILNTDVYKDQHGVWRTGDLERPAGIRRDDSSEDISDSEMSDPGKNTAEPKGLTLSDFMPTNMPKKVKKTQKTRPRTLSDSWDWIPSQ